MAYSGVTRRAILRKVNRRQNPVTSIVDLAREFHVPISYSWNGSTSAPPAFRQHVKDKVGETTYNRIRKSQYVNYSYR